MEYTKFSGKTVNDAIIDACQKLEVTSDKLEYEVVEEGHIICGTCRKDFGSDDEAVERWLHHAISGDFYVGCQNYFVQYIVSGEKCTTVITPAHDECSGCGVVKGE